MIRVILIIAAVMFSSVLGYHFGQQETELRWTQERERILAHQIETLRVRERDAAIQRKLQRELGECGRFRRALELSSKTLAECAERAVSDRRIIERCAIQLR